MSVETPRAVKRLLVWAAAALLLVVALGRGAELARAGWQPSARGEARWFGWAWGRPAERALVPDPFHPAAEGLPPPGPLALEVAPNAVRTTWVHVMAQYALPGYVIAKVRPAGAAADPPAEAAVVPLAPPGLGSEPRDARRQLRDLVALALGCAAALGTGLLLLGAARRPHRWAAELALALPLGLSVAAPLTAGAALLGVRPAAAAPAALVAALLAALAAGGLRRRGRPADRLSRPAPESRPSRLQLVLLALLGLLVALFLARTALAPIWSWDHFAMWGMRARRIHAVGLGPHTFTGPADAFYAYGHHPLGLPFAWLDLGAGAAPGGWLFRTAHALFGVALVVLVRRAARRLSVPAPLATLAACLVAASPLLWDTEALGLADLPFALWSVAAVAAALDPRLQAASRGWAVGLLLGFLPWLKAEGWILLPLLGLALGWAGRRRAGRPAAWSAGLVVTAAALALGSAALTAALPSGESFLGGDALGRIADRLPRAGEILAALAAELAAPEWLAAWFLVAAGLAVAVGRRRWLPTALGAVALAQLAASGAAYLATSMDPLQHLRVSFFRIAAGLLPLALAAASAAVRGRGPFDRDDVSLPPAPGGGAG